MNRRMIAIPSITVAALPRLAAVLMIALACFAMSSTAEARRKGKIAPYGKIRVSTPQAGRKVYFDGAFAGETVWRGDNPDNDPNDKDHIPFILFSPVTPGRHTVEVEMPDGTRWLRDVVVEKGRFYCVGVTYKENIVVPHCYDYPLAPVISQTSKDGDMVSYHAQADYNAPSTLNYALHYAWTIPAGATLVRPTSGGEDTPDITINTAGVRGPGEVRVTVIADDGSGDPNCRKVASAPFIPETCVSFHAKITSSQPNFRVGQRVTFTANTLDYTGTRPLNYKWTVRISPGEERVVPGGPSITVDTTGLSADQRITASVRVNQEGFDDPNCEAQDSLTVGCFDCLDHPKLNDLKARLDNFAVDLNGKPRATAYIYVHGPRREAETVARQARDYMVNTRGINASQVKWKTFQDSNNVHIELRIWEEGDPPLPDLNSVTELEQQRGIQHIPGFGGRRAPRHKRSNR